MTALLNILPCAAKAAKPDAPRNSHWVSSGKGSLKCVGRDGKTLLTFKKGIPTYDSKLPEIPSNYRSINFVMLDKGASVAIFDYNNGGSTVTFYLRGCIPSRTYIYPDLELYNFARELKSGLGLVVALASVNATFSEDYDATGYFVHWDAAGTEKIKIGPFRFPGGLEGLVFYQGERYGEYRFENRGYRHIYLDFSKGVYHEYVQPGDVRAGKQEITSEGLVRFYQQTGVKTPNGKILSIEEFQSLPLPEFQRLAPSIVPQYRLVHEHQF